MGKGTHFIGQPMFGQLISLIDKSKVLGFSREKRGERNVKHFDAWQHLLLMVIQKRIKRTWSFSGLATMFRIMLMYYVNCYTFFEEPEKDWLAILKTTDPSPPEPTLFD